MTRPWPPFRKVASDTKLRQLFDVKRLRQIVAMWRESPSATVDATLLQVVILDKQTTQRKTPADLLPEGSLFALWLKTYPRKNSRCNFQPTFQCLKVVRIAWVVKRHITKVEPSNTNYHIVRKFQLFWW